MLITVKASSGGRGRGYGGKNKELRRPGHSEIETPPTAVSQRLHQTPVVPPSLQTLTPNPPNHRSTPNAARAQKPSMGSGQQYGATVHVLNQPSEQGLARKVSQEERNFCGTGSLSDENSQSVLYIDERYAFLIKQVSLLSAQDDGILTNQKVHHIETILTKSCTQPQMLRQALDAISSAAMLDARMSARVSLLCCSVWFSHSQLLGQRLHHLFIEAMTDKIDGLEISLEGADQYLVNAATLLADIYTESKMLAAFELVTLARLIVQVSIELLECNTQLALRTLNVQLMQHGRKLYQCVPEKLEVLSISARKLLISRLPPAPSCKIWLMLLSDQCLYKLEPLPKYLQDFYARHLDDSTTQQDPELQKDRQLLPKAKDSHKQDPGTKTHDSKPRKSDSSDRWSVHSNGDARHDADYSKYKDEVFDERNPLDSSYDSSGVSESNFSDNNEYSNANGIHGHNSERKPRPILGAGSRMVQNTNVKSDFECNDGPNLSNFDGGDDLGIPKFCPSVPPPNFIPRQKEVTSASQETGDYWNTPPPAINPGKKLDSLTPKIPTSGLAQRLDLNSWRQQANGIPSEEDTFANVQNFNPSQSDSQPNYYDKQDFDQQYGNMGLLEKVKTSNAYNEKNEYASKDDSEWNQGWNEDVENSYKDSEADPSLAQNDRRSDKGNSQRKPQPKKTTESREYKPRNNSAEDESYEVPEERFKKLQFETGTLMWNKPNADASESGDKSDASYDRNGDKRRGNAASARQKDRRSSDTRNYNRERKENDEKDSNWRRRDSDDAKAARGEKDQKWGVKKPENDTEWVESDADKSKTPEDRKSAMRREQRSGSGRTKRDPMEVSRSASYWTHDDRCDRDYDG